MIVITHDGVGQEVDGEDLGQFDEPVFQPFPAVVEVFAAVKIPTAQEGPPDTAGYTVVVGGVIEAYLLAPGYRHCNFVRAKDDSH
jgi:hypothetical protein